MAQVVIGMTISLDGYVEDRAGSVTRLYADLEALRESDMLQQSIRDTGAVVMGRRAYAMADPDEFADSYEYQVPIFVLTHAVPSRRPKENANLTVTFVTDGIESAIRQAQGAAGARDVTVVGGASTFRQCLRAGLADVVHLDIMPVLLGDGLRLFDEGAEEYPLLEREAVVALPEGRTHLRLRVLK